MLSEEGGTHRGGEDSRKWGVCVRGGQMRQRGAYEGGSHVREFGGLCGRFHGKKNI